MRVGGIVGVLLGAVTALALASCSGGTQSADAGISGQPDARFDISVDGGHPTGALRMAVPAYFDPSNAQWQTLIAGAPTVGMIVFNPESGPGTATDPGYTKVIGQGQAAGIKMLGYVGTSYGARPEADVIADINRYYDLYTPSGIYFAEGPMDSDCTAMEAMYHRMASAVLARDSGAFLAIGTRFCPTYIYFFDMMVQFARNWTEYQNEYQPPSWMTANSASRFCHFVHSVPMGEASAALSRVVSNGAGWVFVTDQGEPNPWGVLPTYFDEELATIRGPQ
ncbi:MAG TPA: spherulation-specific family 4 protein [Polyangia bacterium]|jgi:hypothetical protein|nr:spherulation-specific family 4 protein [Polyangia bacterium]